ncbi:MAG: hypothetical protein GOVbin4162_56 [Prokaryotic dsDNA virus sp.]|nr:MAG: hypothetical protein GOVbin4162_56 [Prokaryotic dsDNA virus sp.]|tara:strand:- start:3726 stop:4325 length:600 start_codon:yes stop_codon:yes gene_type:complete
MQGNINFQILFPDSSRQVVEWNQIARSAPPSIEDQEKIVKEEIKELHQAIEDEDILEVLDAFADIFFTAAYLEHLDPDNNLCQKAVSLVNSGIRSLGHAVITEAIMEVIESNYTKFVNINRAPYKHDESSLYQMIATEEERIGRECGMDVRGVVLGDYLVFLDENNKVKKPFTYLEPKLEPILETHLNIKNKEKRLAEI